MKSGDLILLEESAVRQTVPDILARGRCEREISGRPRLERSFGHVRLSPISVFQLRVGRRLTLVDIVERSTRAIEPEWQVVLPSVHISRSREGRDKEDVVASVKCSVTSFFYGKERAYHEWGRGEVRNTRSALNTTASRYSDSHVYDSREYQSKSPWHARTIGA